MRAYHLTSGSLFALVGLVHLIRAVQGWPAEVNGTAIPVLYSYGIFVVTAALAVWAFRSINAR